MAKTADQVFGEDSPRGGPATSKRPAASPIVDDAVVAPSDDDKGEHEEGKEEPDEDDEADQPVDGKDTKRKKPKTKSKATAKEKQTSCSKAKR